MDYKQIITRQQYLEALEVIDMYHLQSSNRGARDLYKITISEWVNNLDKKPSARLHRVLTKFEYFADVNKPAFLDVRNSSPTTWAEFCSLANIKP